MVLSRLKSKGRRETGTYVAIPHCCLTHPNFVNLSAPAVRLFVDLLYQFNGINNGDLCAAWSVMQKRGWRSKGTLHKAIKELREFGWIIVSRQGGRNKASLFAFTFIAVDECKGKLDIAETNVPLGNWKEIKSCARYADQLGTEIVPMRRASNEN